MNSVCQTNRVSEAFISGSSNLCTRARYHEFCVFPFPWFLSSRQMKRSRIGSIYSRHCSKFTDHEAVCRCSFERGASPRRFYRKSISGRVECSFQRYDRRRGRHAWTGWRKTERSTTNDDDRKQKRWRRKRGVGWGETQGKRKNGKINCRKVVRSITCRARPRVIFVRINKSSHVEYTRVARCYKRVQSERRWLQRVEKKVACHAY